MFSPLVKLFEEDKAQGIKRESLFAVLVVMGRLNNERQRWVSFVTELMALIESYDQVDEKLMGFPDDWKKIVIDPDVNIR